ncbi:sensor histidine kinase [Anaeromyxobacter paludicola]|nr:ATP-binding protein [Anaeromyxobacter paludicola]
MLRLRWLIVPVFVAVDLASTLLTNQGAPWTALGFGAGLLLLNAAYSAFLSRRIPLAWLLRMARFESALVVSVPVLVVLLHRDPRNALRYGVLVGVVGAAAVLPRTIEVAVVGIWAIASLVIADVVAMGFDPALLSHDTVARWAMESGIIATVGIIAAYLHGSRELSAERLRITSEAADRARSEWEATVDLLHEAVVVSDLGGAVIRCNRAFAKLLGARPHELAGRLLPQILEGHPPRWYEGKTDGIIEVEDTVFDSLFEITTTRTGDRLVRVIRDVGELRRLYTRLVQADKLAAVGVLASSVAHEINNPTAFVTSNLEELGRYLGAYESGLAELAEASLAAGAAERASLVLQRPEMVFARREAASAVTESLQGMERIRQVVSTLRSAARRDQAGEPASAVSLGEVVDTVVRTASQDLRAAAAKVDLAEGIEVLGHRGELVDVVLNLVVNAIQARDEVRPNRIEVLLRREGSQAVIQVADTGKGIAPQHLKRLFEPFFTTKPAGQGTGLGLSLARNIVLAHGGSIDVESEVDVGTTFTVRLPLLEADAELAQVETLRPRGQRAHP